MGSDPFHVGFDEESSDALQVGSPTETSPAAGILVRAEPRILPRAAEALSAYKAAHNIHPTACAPHSSAARDLSPRRGRRRDRSRCREFDHEPWREGVGRSTQMPHLSPNPPMRSGLGVGTRGEGRGTRRSALDSDKWGRWRPLVVVGGADGGPGQRRWGGVGGTACRGRQSRTGPVRLCGSVG